MVATIVGIMVFATVFAVAASLSISATSLGAGTATVASCDTDGVTTSFETSYNAAVAGYQVTTLHVAGIATPGCGGLTMKATLIGAGDASLGERTVTLATPVANPTDLNFTADNVLAALVVRIAVVIA